MHLLVAHPPARNMMRGMLFATALLGAEGFLHGSMGTKRTLPVVKNKGFGRAGGGPSGSAKKNEPRGLDEPDLSHLGKEWRGFKFAPGRVRPMKQSAKRTVPPSVVTNVPDYANDGVPKKKNRGMPWDIEVKSKDDIAGMISAGRAAREILDAAGSLIRPGITTDDIDALVHEECIKRGGYPSPLNYHGADVAVA